jgi:hypothetical protein
MELFIFKISKNRLSTVESKRVHKTVYIFDTLTMLSSALHTCLILYFNVPFKQGESFKILRMTSAVISDSMLQTMRGVVTLQIKQYGKSLVSVLNSSTEFPNIINTFVTPCYT